MTSFEAKVLENIPANRLLALAGVENDEDGWDTILLKPSELGWVPDFVTSSELEEDSIVSVSVRDNPVWRVEAAQNLPAGTLVMCDEAGRVKDFRPDEGNHIGYTTHSVTEGEVVSIVRKYGHMPQNQVDAASFEFEEQEEEDFSALTKNELKSLLDERGIEYQTNATKDELIQLLEGE